jgi:hypothetical protein
MDNQIKMINAINIVDRTAWNYYDPDVADVNGFKPYTHDSNTFEFKGSSLACDFEDVYQKFNGSSIRNLYVFRDTGNNAVTDGKAFVVSTSKEGTSGATLSEPAIFAVKTSDLESIAYPYAEKYKSTDLYYKQSETPTAGSTSGEYSGAYYETVIHVPASMSFN